MDKSELFIKKQKEYWDHINGIIDKARREESFEPIIDLIKKSNSTLGEVKIYYKENKYLYNAVLFHYSRLTDMGFQIKNNETYISIDWKYE